MDQDFEERTCIRLRCINDAFANGVPSPAMEHRSCGIEDRMASIGDAICEHLNRKSEEELVEQGFHSARP